MTETNLPADAPETQPVAKQQKGKKRPYLRWLISLATIAIVIYLFLPLAKDLRAAAGLFRTANWVWFVIAFGIEILSYASLTGLNILLLKPFEGKISFWRMLFILPAIAFIEVAIPSAGASGAVLRARLLGQSDYTVESSTFTLGLEALYLSIALAASSLFGIYYLLQSGRLGTTNFRLLVGIAVSAVTVGFFLYRAARDPERVKRWARQALLVWNGILLRWNRPAAPMQAVMERMDNFYGGLQQLGQTPRWPFVLAAVGRVALDIATLWACFVAFSHYLSPGVLLTGYGLMLVVSGLAAIPGGLGLTEASLAVIFARLGTPGPVAVAAALAYRLIAFWLLRFIGFINWQILEAKHDPDAKSSTKV